jgi:hypothetical protein
MLFLYKKIKRYPIRITLQNYKFYCYFFSVSLPGSPLLASLKSLMPLPSPFMSSGIFLPPNMSSRMMSMIMISGAPRPPKNPRIKADVISFKLYAKVRKDQVITKNNGLLLLRVSRATSTAYLQRSRNLTGGAACRNFPRFKNI